MKTASAKAKGRTLQNWVADKLKTAFSISDPADLRPALMGENGADIKISRAFDKIIPWAIECKNNEQHTGIYREYDQAVSHSTNSRTLPGNEPEPVLFVKMNRRNPLAVVDAEYLIELLKKTHGR